MKKRSNKAKAGSTEALSQIYPGILAKCQSENGWEEMLLTDCKHGLEENI